MFLAPSKHFCFVFIMVEVWKFLQETNAYAARTGAPVGIRPIPEPVLEAWA